MLVVSVDFMHQYRTGQQHDAHEFLLSVITQMECDAGYVQFNCVFSLYPCVRPVFAGIL